MFINKVILYGNITKDLVIKTLPSGSSVLSFSIATNRKWKDKAGKQQESVEFHNVVAFGKTADLINQYLSKGQGIYIEGRLQTRMWEKDKVKRYSTDIIIEQMQFGNNKKSEEPKKEEVKTIQQDGDISKEVPF